MCPRAHFFSSPKPLQAYLWTYLTNHGNIIFQKISNLFPPKNMTVLNISSPLSSDSQSEINQTIANLSSWKAILPFSGVLGSTSSVDLFEYTKPQYRAKRGSKDHTIKFDPAVYAPNDEGLLLLRTHLSYIALQDGTVLNSRNSKTILSCFRGRTYQTSGRTPAADADSMVDLWGVKLGIREYKFHRDNAFKRAGGQTAVRGCSTSLPLSTSDICSVKLNLSIHKYDENDGYIFMVCGTGSCCHTGHCKPNNGDISVFKRFISPETQKLILNGKEASNGSSAMRYLVLKNKNVFVTRSTLQRIQFPKFLVAGAPGETGVSTASRMVNWLRKQSQEQKIGIRYTVLFHKMLGGDKFHKYPKGRPSKNRPPLALVNSNMKVQLSEVSVQANTPPMITSDPIEPTDYLESLQFDGNSLDENYVKSSLPTDGVYGKDVLSEEALE